MEIACLVCGNVLYVKPSRVARFKYCSKECRNTAESNAICDEIAQRFGKPLPGLINELYQEGMPIRRMPEYFGVNLRTVLRWFDKFGIEKRGVSESIALQWKNNDSRRTAIGKQFREYKKNNPEAAKEHSVIGNLAQQNMKGPTSIERKMMDALNSAGIAYEFQYAVGGKFLCDFFIPTANLIVECDGEYWHEKPLQKKKDASKDAYLRKCGFQVTRFTGGEIQGDIKQCIDLLLASTGSAK